MIKVSVVIPAYNADKYIVRCIESLLKQTLKDIEIIVINDGSIDKTSEKVNQLKKSNESIIFIEKENEGVSVARNRGIESASGEFITFVDADDYVTEQFCEKLYNKIKAEKADLCICGYSYEQNGSLTDSLFSLIDSSNKIEYTSDIAQRSIYKDYGGRIPHSLISSGVTWGKMYRKNFIDENEIRFTPGLIRAQDTIFLLEVLSKTTNVTSINEYLYVYNLNDGSISSGNKYIPDSEEKFGSLLSKYNEFINKESLFNKVELYNSYLCRIIQVIFWHYKHNFFNHKKKESLFSRCKAFKKLLDMQPYKEALDNVNIDFLQRHERVLVQFHRKRLDLLFVVMYYLAKKFRR